MLSGACATYQVDNEGHEYEPEATHSPTYSRERALDERSFLVHTLGRRRNRCPDCPPRTPYTVLPAAPTFRKPPREWTKSLAALKAARQYHEEAERARKAAKKEKQPKVARTKASRLAESQLAEASEMIAMAAKGWIGRSPAADVPQRGDAHAGLRAREARPQACRKGAPFREAQAQKAPRAATATAKAPGEPDRHAVGWRVL